MKRIKELGRRIFPVPLNNDYRGALIALYLFIPLAAITLWRSVHHLVAADGGAQSIATIPLTSLTATGSAAVIGVFSLWGLSQLIIGICYVVALLRYRRLLPLLYLLLIGEYGGRMLIGALKPIPTVDTAPGAVINVPLIIFSIVMFVLAIRTVPRNAHWLRRVIGF